MAETGEISAHFVAEDIAGLGRANGRQIFVVVFAVEDPPRCGLLALVVVCLDTCDIDVDSMLEIWLGCKLV